MNQAVLFAMARDERDVESASTKEGSSVCGEDDEVRVKQEIPLAKEHVDGVKKACHICGKAFNSGKALGGHMRIHVRRSSDVVSKKKHNHHLKPHISVKFKKHTDQDDLKKPAAAGSCTMVSQLKTCPVCLKEFASPKAMYGHMRCHSDRPWRGINRPSNTCHNPSSSCSTSSSLSDEIDHGIVGSTELGLAASLRGWTVTARRGRQRKPLVVNDEDMDAVNCLMMLSQGRVLAESVLTDECECDAASNSFSKAEEVNEMVAHSRGVVVVNGELADDQSLTNEDTDCEMKTVESVKLPVKKECNTVHRIPADFDLNEMPPWRADDDEEEAADASSSEAELGEFKKL